MIEMQGLATWNPLPVIACITCVVSGRWGGEFVFGARVPAG